MKTPQLPEPNLQKALGIKNEVWFKFENKHHFGSHKGRSIPFMIDEYRKQGIKSFVISSSGNAALASLRTVLSHNKNKPQNPISLKIFVGKNIEAKKFEKLKNEIVGDGITIEQTDNPKQDAFNFEKTAGAKMLRGSTDPLALVGYQSLAEELAKIQSAEGGIAAVFIPSSSGTCAEGLYLGFKNLPVRQAGLKLSPQIHIVQTNFCHPLTEEVYFQKGKPIPDEKEEHSLAGAIVDVVGRRREAVARAVIETGGEGWMASDEEIKKAIELARQTTNNELSPNSALSVVGLQKAVSAGWSWKGPVVCLITGE